MTTATPSFNLSPDRMLDLPSIRGETISGIHVPPTDPTNHPIINSPYEPPQWHWTLNQRGVATEPAIPGRRPSMGITPVPSPKAGARQASFDDQSNELTLVNIIRDAVANWRTKGYPNVTNATSRLLRHWRSNQPEPKLFFAQLEAIETLIYLYEVAGSQSYAWEQLAKANLDYNDALRRVAVKMATGTGKTAVMALTIIWQSVNHALNPRDSRFTDKFAVITPGTTVRNRNTRDLIPRGDEQNIYAQWRLVPNDQNFKTAIRNAKVDVTNFQALQHRELRWGQASSKAKKTARMEAQTEQDYDMIQRALPKLAGRGRIIVLNDEGHHCHNTELTQTDREEKKVADVWFKGLQALRRTGQLHSVIDFSATPMFIVRNGSSQNDQIFPWTVSDFPLTDAIEAGMVKIPRVPVADDTRNTKGPIYRNLYANSKGKTKQRREELTQPMAAALHSLYEEHEKTAQAWRNSDTPPVLIIVVNDIPNAQAVFDYVSGYQTDEQSTRTPGRLELFSNVNSDTFDLFMPPRTILVHSRLDSEAQIAGSFGRYLRRQSELYRKAYPRYQWPKEDKDVIQEVLNTVGKKGLPGGQVRCVVSVNMLSEGWDTRTVTHALGFRRFGTQLLCEQVAGRSLRRVAYDNFNERTGRFPPEYAEIFGIPFSFAFDHTPGGDLSPPTPTYEVKSLAERGKYRIVWPNVTGYQMEQPGQDDLTIDWTAFVRIDIAANIPEIVEIEGIMGKSDTFVTQQGRGATAIYNIAQAFTDLLQHHPNGENPKAPAQRTQLFRWAVNAIKHGLKEKYINVQEGKLWAAAQEPHINELTQRLAQACLLKSSEKKPVIRAITQTPPFYTTAEINPYWSSRRHKLNTKKSQLDIAPCGNSWELTVARVLDNHPRVLAWARNDRQRWQIPYMHQGEWQHYEPDFIVRVDQRKDLPLNVVVEVKGQERDSDLDKSRYANQFWIPAVNNDSELSREGPWQYMYVDDPGSAYMMIDQVAGT